MQATPRAQAGGFKRQVVFRISVDEWPLLEQAAVEHGSIQAAVLAGLHALHSDKGERRAASDPDPNDAEQNAPAHSRRAATGHTPEPDEIRAREAARMLGLKTSTVSGYIRSGRLPGRYDETLKSGGWLTSCSAVEAYRKQRGESRVKVANSM